MSDAPLYRSGCSLKSLWQEYLVFADRLEFSTHLGRWTVPFTDIESIEVAEPRIKALVEGRMNLHALLAFKLDLADLAEHVAIDRSAGLARRVVFTPEDPAEFTEAARAAIAAWQAGG